MSGAGRDGPAMAADDVHAYCREVEAYLCRRNDGHLIRVVGPAFELVKGWAAQGIPLPLEGGAGGISPPGGGGRGGHYNVWWPGKAKITPKNAFVSRPRARPGGRRRGGAPPRGGGGRGGKSGGPAPRICPPLKADRSTDPCDRSQ